MNGLYHTLSCRTSGPSEQFSEWIKTRLGRLPGHYVRILESKIDKVTVDPLWIVPESESPSARGIGSGPRCCIDQIKRIRAPVCPRHNQSS